MYRLFRSTSQSRSVCITGQQVGDNIESDSDMFCAVCGLD